MPWTPWPSCRPAFNCQRPSSSRQLQRGRRPRLRVAWLKCRHLWMGRCWALPCRMGHPSAKPSRRRPAHCHWRRSHALAGMPVQWCTRLDVFVVAVIQHVNAMTRSSSRSKVHLELNNGQTPFARISNLPSVQFEGLSFWQTVLISLTSFH